MPVGLYKFKYGKDFRQRVLAQKGQPQRATEILSLYFTHPLRPKGWAEKWSLLSDWQAKLEDTLGTTAYRAALVRGRDLDLIEIAEAILAEGDEAW